MSREEPGQARRTVLKRIGAIAGTLIAGGGAVSGSEPTTADFDPYSFPEVNQYLNNRLVKSDGSLKKSRGGTITIGDPLDREQVEAVIHAMTPRVSVNSITTAFETEEASTQTEITVYGEDPTERWGWETPSHITESVESGSDIGSENDDPGCIDCGGGGGGPTPQTFSNTQEVKAFSVFQPAWEWECVIEWEHYDDEIVDTHEYDLVKHTHHDITHQGTDIDVQSVFDDSVHEVFFQADFHNSLPTVDVGFAEFDLASTFEPWQELQADANGNGELLDSDDDTAWYWKF